MIIKEYFGNRTHEGDIGIEIEVESTGDLLPAAPKGLWTTHEEGSLRGHAKEYVTECPVYNDAKKYDIIKALTDRFHEGLVDLETSRTSTHMHYNIQKWTFNQLYTLLCSYWLFENMLVKYMGGEHREGNHFCLRLEDAEDLSTSLIRDVRLKRHLESFYAHRELRYSAINLAAVPKFGSIEYRFMRCSVNGAELHHWTTVLARLTEMSKQFHSPAKLMDYAFQKRDLKEELMGQFFTPDVFRELTGKNKYWADSIDDASNRISEFAYCVNWDKLEPDKPAGYNPFPNLEQVVVRPRRGEAALLPRGWRADPVDDPVANAVQHIQAAQEAALNRLEEEAMELRHQEWLEQMMEDEAEGE